MTFHAVPRRDPVLIIEFASGSRSAEWLELRRLPQILLVLVRRTINYSKGLSLRNREIETETLILASISQR